MTSVHSRSGQAVPASGAIGEPVFADSNATVTYTVAHIAGVTYQVSAIAMMYVKENRRTNWLGTAVVTALLLGAAVAGAFWALGNRQELRWVCYVFAGSCLAAPWLLRMKREYSLVIATAAGERAAFTSADRTYVGSLRSHIEQAMTIRAGLDRAGPGLFREQLRQPSEPPPDFTKGAA